MSKRDTSVGNDVRPPVDMKVNETGGTLPDGAPVDNAPAPDAAVANDVGGEEIPVGGPDAEPEAPGGDDTAPADLLAVDMVAIDNAAAPDTGQPEAAADTEPEIPAIACTASSECGAGVCTTGICRASSKLLLYWTFDDQDGAITATDSSGNNLNGTYTGNGDVAAAPFTTAVPPAITFPDPASRSFVAATRHGVRLPAMPPALRLANNLSISAWFRVKDRLLGKGNGSELISAGDQYSLRVMSGELEFSKRTTNVGGTSGSHIQVRGVSATHLDGNWHHLAGVATPQGMRVYLDGVMLKLGDPALDGRFGSDVKYDKGADFWVGRHGAGSGNYDFNGDIDEIRVYGRALTDGEIMWLAAGKP